MEGTLRADILEEQARLFLSALAQSGEGPEVNRVRLIWIEIEARFERLGRGCHIAVLQMKHREVELRRRVIGRGRCSYHVVTFRLLEPLSDLAVQAPYAQAEERERSAESDGASFVLRVHRCRPSHETEALRTTAFARAA